MRMTSSNQSLTAIPVLVIKISKMRRRRRIANMPVPKPAMMIMRRTKTMMIVSTMMMRSIYYVCYNDCFLTLLSSVKTPWHFN